MSHRIYMPMLFLVPFVLAPSLSMSAPSLPLTSIGAFDGSSGISVTLSDVDIDHTADDDDWFDSTLARQSIGGVYYTTFKEWNVFYGGAFSLDGTVKANGSTSSGGSGFTLLSGLIGDIPVNGDHRAHWYGEILYQDDDFGDRFNLTYSQSGITLTGGAHLRTTVSPVIDLSGTVSYTFYDDRSAKAVGE